jgi:SnoaL-like domain
VYRDALLATERCQSTVMMAIRVLGTMADNSAATVCLPASRERESMTPKQLVEDWVTRFNAADTTGLAALYAEDAINHQVVMEPLHGREAILHMFNTEFARATMTCIVENLFESGEWAILEWRDPLGLRGCGFFHIRENQIVFQRGYFDQLSFFRMQGIPVPESYLGS